jgi:hemoglobin-like flavoprotein/Ran GTPase-activating protein (RanGAP) involved in mRNA processing and transport
VSRHLTRLRVLDVSGNEIGAAGAAALALSGNVATLTTLSLGRNCLGLEGVALLLASNRFGSLMELDVSSNTIGAQGAMTLAASPAVRRLRMLDVGDNGLGDAGLAALLGAPYLTGLRRLRLAQNGITASGVALLGVTPAELNDLDLSGNPVGPTGAMAMRGVLGRMRLSRLMVDDCGLGADGCAAIAEDAPATLVRLSLAGNAIGADGAARLAAVDAAHRLTDLDASHNDLGAAGLAALLRWPALAGLRSLAADGNGIGDHCAALVAAIAALPELADLRLRDNGLGPAAIERLGASPMATRLAALDLAFNRIADAGATTLARHCHGLRRLDLERNGLTLAAAASIWSSPAMPDLHAANLARNALAGLVDLQSLARRKVTLLEDSFARLVPQAADVAARFYERLFERYPSVKPLFAHTAMRRQQQHFVAALTLVIEHLRAPDAAAAHLRALGARHADHGAWPSHYPAVTGVLLDTLRDAMGPSWTKEVEAAWQQGLDAVSAAMIDGQQAARRAAGPELS